VLVVAQDDHLPPLSVADLLSAQGREVTLVYGPGQAGQQLGRYILGGILSRLYGQQVRFRHHEQVVAVGAETATVRNIYSGRTADLTGLDTVVLACGGDPDARLYDALAGAVPERHLLGDAFAPRRLVFATRQAYSLAQLLLETLTTTPGAPGPTKGERI
jgi:hypothetical protein